MDYTYFTGCFLAASSVSKGLGSFTKIYLIFSFINASVEIPPPPTSLGRSIKIVSQIVVV